MKFSEAWLREFISPKVNTSQLCEGLTNIGLEVDDIAAALTNVENIFIGKILKLTAHPQSDSLQIATVDIKTKELTLVSAAQNLKQGAKVLVATIGANIQGKIIQATEFKSVLSEGMLLAKTELDIEQNDTESGIWILPEDALVGQSFEKYINANDSVIDIDLTPNRGDCLSILGIAREIAAIHELDPPVINTSENSIIINSKTSNSDKKIKVELNAQKACSRYICARIENIDNSKQLPIDFTEKLRRSGIRSINPVVDITNYVMLEIGQPMHAFDTTKLGNNIIVRYAKQGESIDLLDGTTTKLENSDLVIADKNSPVAIAGVMGSEHSKVDSNTTDVVLEAAYFDAVQVMQTARKYKLHSDSSYRFERGVDYQLQSTAIHRAIELIIKYLGGNITALEEVQDQHHLPKSVTINLKREHINSLLGMQIADNDVTKILCNLGLKLKPFQDGWEVKIPSYRFDLTQEVDLIEEVVRIYGYSRIEVKPSISLSQFNSNYNKKVDPQKFKNILIGLGYNEAITYSFIDNNLMLKLEPNIKPIALQNPISADLNVMRTNVWGSLLRPLLHNINRQQPDIRLFEIGERYIGESVAAVDEQCVVAGIATGCLSSQHWNAVQKSSLDFFDIKADVMALCSFVDLSNSIQFKALDHPAFHPGQSAAICFNEKQVGIVGKLHPQILQFFNLKQDVFVFEILLSVINTPVKLEYQAYSKFPQVRRDLSFIIQADITADEILTKIKKQLPADLKQSFIFDIFAGKDIPDNHKSIGLALIFQNESHTLKEQEVNNYMESVVQCLTNQCQARLRD